VSHSFLPSEGGPERQPPDPRRSAMIGLGVVALLVALGLYLIHALGSTSRLQDCVMQGRSNCAPVDASTAEP
jgi:hypothetical protein